MREKLKQWPDCASRVIGPTLGAGLAGLSCGVDLMAGLFDLVCLGLELSLLGLALLGHGNGLEIGPKKIGSSLG